MATMYAHPAAANYYSHAPGHGHSQPRDRGYRLCDHCSAVETSSGPKFRLCGGCMTTQYCSQDCQRSNWPSHKAICQHTAAQVSALKQQPHSGSGYTDENIAKNLRRFASAHQGLLSWAAFQALQIKRLPANIRQNCLLVELSYHGSGSEAHRKFSIAGTHIVPRSYIMDPLVTADIQRRDDRCRRMGGIGTAVVIVQCGGASQVMPVEVDPPSKIAWDVREDWNAVLHQFVQSGNTDFKPISTTSRGVYYG